MKTLAILSNILILIGCSNSPQKKIYIPKHYISTSAAEDDLSLQHTNHYERRYYQPRYPVKLEVYENSLLDLQNFLAQHNYESPYRPLIGHVTEDPMDVLTTSQLLVGLQQSIKNKKQLNLMTEEVLTKVLAYRELKIGQEVPIPVCFRFKKPTLVLYVVNKVFDLGGGMPAFGLIPKSLTVEAPPILLFRGTNFSLKGFSSIMADLDLNGPGMSAFYSSRRSLHNWLLEAFKAYGPTRVMGYSLGGSFAQYTCIYEHELVSKDKTFPSVIFNQPGIFDDMVYEWDRLSKKQKPCLRGYVTEGDFVSTVGKLIGDVKELTLEHPLEPLPAHVTLMSAQQRFYAYRLDVTLKHELDYSAECK
ncbi:MAG: hypothetical protein FJZ63_01705 [Chlamydiae bacterium]|nr:hypothetical protein [Chlamydiota bacterium]